MAASKRLYVALAESIGLELGYQRSKVRNAEILGEAVNHDAVHALRDLLGKIMHDLRSDNHRFDSERFEDAVNLQAARTCEAYLKVERA